MTELIGTPVPSPVTQRVGEECPRPRIEELLIAFSESGNWTLDEAVALCRYTLALEERLAARRDDIIGSGDPVSVQRQAESGSV